ncbi:MAG TPA: 30S ribosomal protein S8 [Candidatus Paceibacterota bacterium]|nr:30S ribosomal protein S8 [Verrucomicrobiota bacterium]HRY47249.1 30S ribosomal protein S8 [Candidatus Paceibacterota bacterium]
MIIDPIADMLTRIRNANAALLPEVVLNHSRLKENIARILKQEGYIEDCSVDGQVKKQLKLKLKYQGRKGIIENLRRASRPGLRRYVRAADIPRVLGGMGTVILSTPRGVMTGTEARRQKVGGEVLCYVW